MKPKTNQKFNVIIIILYVNNKISLYIDICVLTSVCMSTIIPLVHNIIIHSKTINVNVQT